MLVELHDVPVGAEAFASPSITTPFAPWIEPPTQTSPSFPVHPDDTRLWATRAFSSIITLPLATTTDPQTVVLFPIRTPTCE